MPKIKKIRKPFQGDRWREFEIYFSERKGFYIKNCPKRLENITGFVNHSDTLEGIERSFDTHLRKYKEIVQTTKKVLIIDFQVGSKVVMKQTGTGSWSGDPTHPLYKFNDFSGFERIDGLGFTIDYKAAYERDVEGEKSYFNIFVDNDGVEQEGSESRLSKGDIVIDYTEEREKFLINLQGSMLEMMLKIGEFFSKSPKELATIIDSKKALLPSFREEKK